MLTAQEQKLQHCQEWVSQERTPLLSDECLNHWLGLILILTPWLFLLVVRSL
jgi:hypothetical protein